MVNLQKVWPIVGIITGIASVTTGIAAIIMAVQIGLWADQSHRNIRTLITNQADQSENQMTELKRLVSMQRNMTEQVYSSLNGQTTLLSKLTNAASGMTQTLTTMSQHLTTMDKHLVTQTDYLRDIAEQREGTPEIQALTAMFSPPVIPGARTIGAVAAKLLLERGAVFIDVRRDEYWNSGRIPGAIHLAFKAAAFTKDALSKVASKDQDVVIYCMGPACPHASVACAWAVVWNFQNVYYFREGYPGWKTAGYPIERNGTMN